MENKKGYQFGDITKGVVSSIFGSSSKDESSEKKQKSYQFGDYTKSMLKYMSSESQEKQDDQLIADEYQYGDYTKGALKWVASGALRGMSGSQDDDHIKIPGPRPRMFIGNLEHILPDPWTAAATLNKKYGGIVELKILDKILYIISHPDYLESVLNSPDKKIPEQELAGEGVFLADGETWQFARSVLQPIFIEKHIGEFIPIFTLKSNDYISKLEKIEGGNGSIECFSWFEKLTFEIICKVGFDYDPNIGEGVQDKFNQNFEYLLEQQLKRQSRLGFINALPTRNNMKFKKCFGELNECLDDILDRPLTEERADLLKLMMNAKHEVSGEKFSHENLRHQIITILVAGHKTTSLLMSWCLFLVSQNPNVEAKLIQELFTVFPNGCNIDEEITMKKLGELKYLNRVMKETIRLYPPAQSVLRGVPKGGLEVGDYFLRENGNIFVSTVNVHMNPKFWPNPTKFDPDRFLPENMKDWHPYQYIPFGGGVRTCLGNLFALTEAKITLTHIFRSYHVKMVAGHRILIGADPLYPTDGIKFEFFKREPPKDIAILEEIPLRESAVVEKVAPKDWNELYKIDSKEKQPILILYGSNHGTCSQFATEIAKTSEKQRFIPTVSALDEYDFQNKLKDESCVIIVCSVYNGQPPDNAVNFFNWISKNEDKNLLSKVKYAVFGVGNSQWLSTFQRIPKIIDEKMTYLGAQRLFHFSFGDEDEDAETAFSGWQTVVWPEICAEFSMVHNSVIFGQNDVNSEQENEPVSNYCINLRDDAKLDKIWKPKRFYECEVLENRELQDEKSGRSTKHVEILLPKGISYETGDHLEILASNPPNLVNHFCEILKIDPNQKFEIDCKDLKKSIRLPDWAIDEDMEKSQNYFQVFSNYYDIANLPPRNLIQVLSYFAQDPETQPKSKPQNTKPELWFTEKDLLKKMCSTFEEGVILYNSEVVKKNLSVVELFENFPSIKIPVELLLENLNTLKPRFYSISSSNLVSPDKVTITVGVVNWESATKKIHDGVASTLISQIPKGGKISCCVKTSNFRLPKHHSRVIACTGNGTGIAPFRGFLQELDFLKKQGEKVGGLMLFWGCRNHQDYIYQDELENFVKSGACYSLEVAFSRLTDEKVYVQHKMKEKQKEVYDIIENQNGSFYLCGARTMGSDIMQIFGDIIKKESGKTDEEVSDYTMKLQDENRYMLDVWG